MSKRIIPFCFFALSIVCSLDCSSQERGTNNDTDQVISGIRQKINRINSQIGRYGKIEKEIFEESAEGGVLTGFYNKTELKKISATFYGETGQALTEYYFDKGKLFFVFIRTSFYDKPVYIKGSKIDSIEEHRFYFYQHSLIKWITPGNQSARKTSEEFLLKSSELLEDVKRYKKLLGVYKPDMGPLKSTDTVHCKFGMTCPSTGFIIKGSRTANGQAIHVNPLNKNVPEESK